MKSLGESLSHKEIEDMIAEADEDGDGEVSYRGTFRWIHLENSFYEYNIWKLEKYRTKVGKIKVRIKWKRNIIYSEDTG